MGIPEYEAKRYEGAVKDGGTLLSVHCDTSEEIKIAKEALRDTGAHDISSANEAGAEDYDERDAVDEETLVGTSRPDAF
jgi:imidazolonepropionase-like amidohydrolase